MKRQFGLPAAFALTLLAFLFFGFAKADRSALPQPGKGIVIVDYPFPQPPPPDEVEEVQPSTVKSSTASLPSLPELFKPIEQGTIPFEPLLRPSPVGPVLPDAPVLAPDNVDVSCGCGNIVGTGPVEASGLDNPPRATVQSPPAYPPNARAAGLTGEVWVEFAVDEAGRVLRTRVVRSSDPMFDEPTLRAVAKWRFEPGRKNGRPVSFRMIVPVNYRLN